MDRRALLALAGAGLASAATAGAAVAQPRPVPRPVPITIRSFPVNSFLPREAERTRFGQVDYRGGLELQSDHPDFGGLSAIRLDPAGRQLTGLTDKGFWLGARIDMEGARIAGLSQARMAPILGPGGRTLASTGDWDTESLWIEGGTAWVGVERTHRIFRFDTFGREGFLARGTPIPVPMGGQRLPSNRGIEALGVLPRPSPLAGTLLALSERGLNAAGDIRGFLIGRDGASELAVKRTNEFDITDLAFLPNGDLLILERWFSALRGVAFRIRRIGIDTVRPGATLDGPIIVSGDMSAQVDNMEGLAVHREADGETILTIVSDNNFSFLQRTLLLQFAWKG